MCCYIVFFKQKTAYEMRISDWSSDVCSSDLDHRIEKEAKGGKEHASCHRDAERIVTEREHQVLADVAHGGARQHDRLEHTGQVAANQSDTGAFDRHVGAGSHRNAYMRSRQCWRVVDRSEEHTSELQSLLRISYAVFCLDTKNND